MPKTKEIFHKTSGWITKKLSLNGLIKRSGVHIIFPFYHVVSDETLPHIRHLYNYPSEKKFTNDLDFLLKHFEPMHPDELMSENVSASKNKFLLSFDDGLKELATLVAPILKKKGVPALFFLNSGFIDNRDLFYRYKISILIDRLKAGNENDKDFLLHLTYQDTSVIDVYAERAGVDFKQFLKDHQPYLTTAQIKQLHTDGFVFGGHSIDHPPFDRIPLEEQVRQATSSVQSVNEMVPQPYHYFAFPFTDEGVTTDFFRQLEMNQQLVIHKTFGTAGLRKPEGDHLQRIPMEKENLSAEEILKNEYSYYRMKNLMGK